MEKDWAELHKSYKRRFSRSKRDGVPFTPSDDEREAHRLYGAMYASTPEGRAILRAGSKKYRASEKGIIQTSIYNRSEKHRKSTERWAKTPRGIESRYAAQSRYRGHKPPNHTDLTSLVVLQSGCCPICLLVFSEKLPARLDHCHETGAVRGALCDHCNLAIGLLNDDPDCLNRGANYLLNVTGEVDLKKIGLIKEG